jgi:hypothetical protein
MVNPPNSRQVGFGVLHRNNQANCKSRNETEPRQNAMVKENSEMVSWETICCIAQQVVD